MDTRTIVECSRDSFRDTPFPEIVGRLAAVGVRSYRADLLKLESAYYDAGGETFDKDIPLADPPTVAGGFDKVAVVNAVHAIQLRQIGYAEFLCRIMAAGCASYSVFMGGRKAVYFGRDGDFHIEDFPAPAS